MPSKRFKDLSAKIDKNTLYPIEEAVKLAKETSNTKFDSSIEVHIRTSIDPKKGDQQMRSTISLPHGTGKKIKIAVAVADDKAKELKDCGADIVGGTELIDRISKTQKIDFDVLLTTPDFMGQVAKLAKILGPKGLMPNPKNETVTPNIKKAVDELSKGKISYKNDDSSNIHFIIGKASFDDQKLIENYNAAISQLNKAKPESIKAILIKSIAISSTMGPGIKIQL